VCEEKGPSCACHAPSVSGNTSITGTALDNYIRNKDSFVHIYHITIYYHIYIYHILPYITIYKYHILYTIYYHILPWCLFRKSSINGFTTLALARPVHPHHQRQGCHRFGLFPTLSLHGGDPWCKDLATFGDGLDGKSSGRNMYKLVLQSKFWSILSATLKRIFMWIFQCLCVMCSELTGARPCKSSDGFHISPDQGH